MADTAVNVTLLAALVVALLVAYLSWRWPFPTLAGFLLLLLIHEVVLRTLRGPIGVPNEIVMVVSRMRMVGLVMMCLVFAARKGQEVWRTRQIPRPNTIDVLMAVVLLVAGVATLLSPNRMAAIAALRNYIQPVAIFYLARGIHPTEQQLRRLLYVWLGLGILIAGFGLYQWFVWQESDYARNGYVLAGGELDTAYYRVEGERRVRPPSTLTGPNEFGLQMAFLLLAAVPWAARTRGRWRWLLWGASCVFLIALAYSYSRSAFLALLAGLACLGLFAISSARGENLRRMILTRKALAVGMALLVVFFGVLAASGMAGRIVRTLQRLPQEYHVKDTLLAIDYLAEYPLGPGMGLVGPREGEFFPKVKEYHVEGTLFQIAMDMSVFGSVAWLVLWGVALVHVWRAWRIVRSPLLQIVDGLAFSAWIAALLTFLILPLMQSFSVMGWLWFFLGLAYTSEDVQRTWDAGGDRPVPANGPALAQVG